MKQILITGVNSYIGNATEQYLMEWNSAVGREVYHVDKVSLREDGLERLGLLKGEKPPYDAVLHVAGIAHADTGHVSEETKALYYRVNCDLAVETARKAKAAGIPQFIYLSSIIVFGDSAKVGRKKHITAETLPEPANFYGDSKLQAEKKLRLLESESFHVAVLRPPMVYGKGSKGNFPVLVKLAGKLPFFPDIENERSMIYVENLAEFIRLLVDNGNGGVFFPQNREYVTTARMVKEIGEATGKKIRLLGFLNPFVKLTSKMPGKAGQLADKAFGSLTISKELSGIDIEAYQTCSLSDSIKKSVKP